ncbi:uncharacterized protein PV06_03934 [Exophiala oligosperma]|uniref:Uncharacterized protein n=1 Tax=Exophiala oligosperma TaxID=215243 RepID=A0A0D2DRJ5_9EURO|nr:uncharacterized protein PV06_03934 [Exophiala oligosperma]KIW45553.1 hypothetical protein PV06_03934 [Exophiala oligosperma]
MSDYRQAVPAPTIWSPGFSVTEASSCRSSLFSVLNIEFWGSIDNGASPDFSNRQANNSYKTVRLISEDSSWLFSRWCTGNQTELYNTLVSFVISFLPPDHADAVPTPGNSGRRMGTARQRHHNLTTVMSKARNLTDAEIGTKVQCHAPDYCGAITDF